MVISAVTTGEQEINVSTATSAPHLQQKIYYNIKKYLASRKYIITSEISILPQENILKLKKYLTSRKYIVTSE